MSFPTSVSHLLNCLLLLTTYSWNRSGKVDRRGLSLQHLCPQKSVCFPLPTIIFLPLRYKSLILIRSAQHGEWFTVLWSWYIPPSILYFFLTIFCHIPSLVSRFHHHLHSKLTLNLSKLWIPSPPFFLGVHTTGHLTIWYFLFFTGSLPFWNSDMINVMLNWHPKFWNVIIFMLLQMDRVRTSVCCVPFRLRDLQLGVWKRLLFHLHISAGYNIYHCWHWFLRNL